VAESPPDGVHYRPVTAPPSTAPAPDASPAAPEPPAPTETPSVDIVVTAAANGAASASGLADLRELAAPPPQEAQPQDLIRPPALAKGDTIGVVAPSYSPRPGWLARGVKALERAGFSVVLDPEIGELRRFTRKEDERRAENFMGMWLDPRVRAVIGGTGGYGAVRMIPYLDPAIFRANPKAFVGYSDITALHLWLMRCAGLRVFHGPTVDDLIPSGRDPTMVSLLSSLTTPRPNARIGRDLARAVRPGRASGRLVGGNLSLVQQTIGTPYEIDVRDAILFLEETRDPMSVVDERLVHLRAAGLLRQVRGIVFGQLTLDRSEEDEFEDFLLDLLADLDVPILMDFPAGHEVPNLTLPLGTEVELVVDELTGWLVYREDALAS
jgi:muramoyltetrapeptide carboxypeptidase